MSDISPDSRMNFPCPPGGRSANDAAIYVGLVTFPVPWGRYGGFTVMRLIPSSWLQTLNEAGDGHVVLFLYLMPSIVTSGSTGRPP